MLLFLLCAAMAISGYIGTRVAKWLIDRDIAKRSQS